MTFAKVSELAMFENFAQRGYHWHIGQKWWILVSNFAMPKALEIRVKHKLLVCINGL